MRLRLRLLLRHENLSLHLLAFVDEAVLVVVGSHCFGAGFAAIASDFVDESVLVVAGFAAVVFDYLDDIDLPEVVYCPPVGVFVVAGFALPPRHFLQCFYWHFMKNQYYFFC